MEEDSSINQKHCHVVLCHVVNSFHEAEPLVLEEDERLGERDEEEKESLRLALQEIRGKVHGGHLVEEGPQVQERLKEVESEPKETLLSLVGSVALLAQALHRGLHHNSPADHLQELVLQAPEDHENKG